MRPIQITTFFGSKGLNGKHLVKAIMSYVDMTKYFENGLDIHLKFMSIHL